MDPQDAHDLLLTAIEPAPGVWVDLGAGTGTFTRAIASILVPPSRIHAIDTDRSALASIGRDGSSPGVELIATVGDFTDPHSLAAIGDSKLDGILAANALHFVRDVEEVLSRWIARLAPDGRVVVIEYDRRAASRWVPYPLPPARLAAIAKSLGLSRPIVTATRPSEYSGELYVATVTREHAHPPSLI